jgi:uncharacterized protein
MPPRKVEPKPSEPPSLRTKWLRRVRRWLILYVLTPYLGVTLVLAVFQRRLIYHPTKAAAILAQDAQFPAGQIHDVRLKAPDGLTLHGWLVLADGHTAQRQEPGEAAGKSGRKLVLYFPGNAGNRAMREEDCRDFTELGLDVVLFDYRGYGENPGSPSETALAADAQAAWTYVTQQLHLPPQRIILFGESLGGGVATRLASELCQRGTPPAGLIAASTFSSMSDVAARQFPCFPVRLLLLDRYPSQQRIASVTCPILCLHGTNDDLVPFELARRLFAAAPSASTSGIEKRFVTLPGAGHNDIPKGVLCSEVRTLLDHIDGKQTGAETTP